MKLWILLPILVVMLLLAIRRAGMLAWIVAWSAGTFIFLRFGFTVPIPISVIYLYMGIVTLALLVYVYTDAQRVQAVWQPIVAFIVEPRYRALLVLTVLAIPALVAAQIYAGMTRVPQAPTFARTVHPAPPEQISIHDTEYALGTIDSPYRELEDSDPEAFAERLAAGRVVYYENCFYCHGDMMRGDGMFAHALFPIPTNFQDPGTIAMLRESFLFWRIAKGAPGLPEEGGPWASAMPAWESFLSQEEMWNVVLFLYEFTEQRPRAVEELH